MSTALDGCCGTNFYQFEDASRPSDNSNRTMVGGFSLPWRKVVSTTPQGKVALAANDLIKAKAGDKKLASGIKKVFSLAKSGHPKAKEQAKVYQKANEAIKNGTVPPLPAPSSFFLTRLYEAGIA